MLLRVSGELSGTELGVTAITRGAEGSAEGIAHGELLVRFAEAVVRGDESELAAARRALLAAVGPEAFVDAAAVAANFQRMVRVADGTGIPLDAPLELVSQELRAELGLERFGSSANTPRSGRVRRALGALLRPIAWRALRRIAARPGGGQRA